jgi:tetratricopeptide (TPR) repeat protein
MEYPDAGVYVLYLRQHPHDRTQWLEVQLAAAQQLKERDSECVALGNLGLAWFDLGEARKAIQFYEQVLTIAREIGDRRVEGNALWNMSLSVDSLGDRVRAIALAEAALKIYQAIESPYAERVRNQLAEWRGQGGTE